ncbi:MAG: Hsp20/alpha crystallin family protein [Chloroflexi bacterium]|nr:MAG: Hsp20/alpha crystallin family protein [Chloroflexota bacterium]HDN79148.1 Hsp20/alpha crystallin family protein [Chloroflexota bacterium]
MAEIVRWEPFRELISLREAMDRLFEESFVRPFGWIAPAGTESFAIDMYETDDEIVVKAAIPGVKPEDIDVSLSGDVLTIKGEVKEGKEIREENYIRRERRYGTFCRSVSLPVQVDVDKAKAEYENGILTLTLPKAEAVKPKVIKVKAKK